MDEKDKLEILKDILFAEEHEFEQRIAERLGILEQTINERKKLSEKVDPIIAQQIDEFKESIPTSLGPVITATLKEEIKNSRDDVVDALFPIIGKMIKKYVAQEIRLLSEKINKQLAFKSPFHNIKRKFKSWFGGVKEEELILSELTTSKIEQVLVIERGTGILTASFSDTETIDEEMVSGMLTAIKSFVEDAFGKRNQNLEFIEYELYHIQIQSFIRHYVAVVISGNYSQKSKNKVQDIIFDFYYDYMSMKMNGDVDEEQLQQSLFLNFDGASI